MKRIITADQSLAIQLDTLALLGRHLWTLGKPRVVMVMLVCALVGMLLARPVMPSLILVIQALTGIGLASMGAAAFNHCIDQKFDRQMRRTASRPVATGIISTPAALLYASLLSILGLGLLWSEVNPLTAILTALALLGYAGIYTAFLKHATPQNITIGGLAGAAPPLLGWTAVTNHIDGNAMLLVLIIFAWTPAHFWALAIHKREEYSKADIPMLPVTHGNDFTRLQIWLYTWLTIIASLLPFVVGMSGYLYLALIIPLSGRWIWFNWRVFAVSGVADQSTGDKLSEVNDQAPMQAFWFSIRYLLYLFLALLFDHFIYSQTNWMIM